MYIPISIFMFIILTIFLLLGIFVKKVSKVYLEIFDEFQYSKSFLQILFLTFDFLTSDEEIKGPDMAVLIVIIIITFILITIINALLALLWPITLFGFVIFFYLFTKTRK